MRFMTRVESEDDSEFVIQLEIIVDSRVVS